MDKGTFRDIEEKSLNKCRERGHKVKCCVCETCLLKSYKSYLKEREKQNETKA